MFLDKTIKDNKKLIDYSINLHKEGKILPDTYVIDVDTLIDNATKIYNEANKYNIKLYYMTKQFGRNPYIAKKLKDIGYEGVVAVDYKEALIMHENNIKVSHIGHLVQVPKYILKKVILDIEPEVITVFSIDKIKEINDICKEYNIKQKILIRVYDDEDTLYPSQYGGFNIDSLNKTIKEIIKFENIEIEGLTAFPCFLFDTEKEVIKATNNINTIKKAKRLIESNYDIKINQMDMPSATSVYNIKEIKKYGGTHGEPGHALTGSTPMHAVKDLEEKLCMVYVSEISHNLKDTAYCFGGGNYRRSHLTKAMVVNNDFKQGIVDVIENDPFSIDYYFELKGNHEIGSTVIMNFRTQIFVTRSDVALVEGLKYNSPKLVGIYDSLGRKKGL